MRFSPYDYVIYADPYPVYARLRDEAPIYRNTEVVIFLTHYAGWPSGAKLSMQAEKVIAAAAGAAGAAGGTDEPGEVPR